MPNTSGAKDNMSDDIIEELEFSSGTGVELDCIIQLKGTSSQDQYPEYMRLVQAYVEVKDEMKLMTFFSNNFDWPQHQLVTSIKAAGQLKPFLSK